MKDWIRTEELFCDEYRALVLLDHRRELKLLKELIEITEKSVGRKKADDTFSFEGVCYLFAQSIVGYAKTAFDNMLLGHFEVTFMVCRALIENNVCLDILIQHEDEELWKYYLIQSYTNVMRRSKTRKKEYKKTLDELCESYHISEEFRRKQKQNDGSYKALIDKNYGWTYKINENFSFAGLCKLVDPVDYHDFQFMSMFSHGTNVYNKIFKDASIDRIMNLVSCLYYGLKRLVMMYSVDMVEEEFYDVIEELERILCEYVGEGRERLMRIGGIGGHMKSFMMCKYLFLFVGMDFV